MSYFDQQCLQALQGIERNLDRIATMYEKTEKLKIGVLTPNMAFPEYADAFNERQKELEKIFMPKSWVPNYNTEPEPEKEIHACDTCAHNPPSSLSGHPCAMCDTSNPLYDCWEKKETNDDQI